MSTLYAFGGNPRRFFSVSAAAQTTDGITWTNLAQPFAELGQVQAVTRSVNTWMAVSSQNQFATSMDLQSWTAFDPENRIWLIRNVLWGNNHYLAVGMEKNLTDLTESAVVLVSYSGTESTWYRTYSTEHENTMLYDAALLGNNSWVVVGGVNQHSPLMLWSQDQGLNWTQVLLPSYLNSSITSVAYHNVSNTMWVGGKGWIATGIWQDVSTQWSVNDAIRDSGLAVPVTRIIHADVMSQPITLAISGSSLFASVNDVDWSSTSWPGYRLGDVACFFNSVHQQYEIYTSAWGLLNQYTGFVGVQQADGSLVHTGYNNGISAQRLIVV
jgi:hypothetical protein